MGGPKIWDYQSKNECHLPMYTSSICVVSRGYKEKTKRSHSSHTPYEVVFSPSDSSCTVHVQVENKEGTKICRLVTSYPLSPTHSHTRRASRSDLSNTISTFGTFQSGFLALNASKHSKMRRLRPNNTGCMLSLKVEGIFVGVTG